MRFVKCTAYEACLNDVERKKLYLAGARIYATIEWRNSVVYRPYLFLISFLPNSVYCYPLIVDILISSHASFYSELHLADMCV